LGRSGGRDSLAFDRGSWKIGSEKEVESLIGDFGSL